MSSFDLMAAVAEMQLLVGGRVDQVYQVSRDELVLRIRTPEKEKHEVYIQAGRWFGLRPGVPRPERPPPYGMTLRKHLANAVLEGIEQRGFERVIVLRLQKRETYELVLELFGRGNVVLVREGVIVAPMFRQTWRERVVRAGQPYRFPPERANPLTLDAGGIAAVFADSVKDLVRTLALDLNLGGTYAEEVVARVGLEKSRKASELSGQEVEAIHGALGELGAAVTGALEPTLVREGTRIVDATPMPLTIHSELQQEAAESFNAGLATLLDSLEAQEPQVAPADPRRARLIRRLENLEEARDELLRRAEGFRRAAEFIYANFQPVEVALEAARAGESAPLIHRVNYDRGWVEIDAGGEPVRLETRLGANQNADALYQKAKDAQEKAEAMLGDLEEARGRLEELPAAAEAAPPPAAPRKVLWFERFRWFLSTEGHLVLAGRDARSNEALVKKHLQPGDRYAHADVQGAPSVVVKEGSEAGEATLDEACRMAVAYSRLWKAGAGSGSAYWVTPEQVSKTPQSGEFLAKGAFVIRGKRNYRRNLPLEAGVGMTEYDGERVVMGGPPAAVAARCEAYVLVSPGAEPRKAVAEALGEAWGVPAEDVLRALPSGGLRVVETVPASLSVRPA